MFILGFSGVSDTKKFACNAGDLGSIPGLGRSPAERNGNLLQYSCLENSMDSGRLQSMGLQRVGHDGATKTWLTQTHHVQSKTQILKISLYLSSLLLKFPSLPSFVFLILLKGLLSLDVLNSKVRHIFQHVSIITYMLFYTLTVFSLFPSSPSKSC